MFAIATAVASAAARRAAKTNFFPANKEAARLSVACVGQTDPPPPLRILQEQHGGPGAPGSDPSIPPSISIIYRSRDRFAFAKHHITLATDPGGSGVGSASKMLPAAMDPLRLAALGKPQGVGSASKMSPAAMDPLRVTALGQPQGVGSASKTSLPPPDPLALVEVADAPRTGSVAKRLLPPPDPLPSALVPHLKGRRRPVA